MGAVSCCAADFYHLVTDVRSVVKGGADNGSPVIGRDLRAELWSLAYGRPVQWPEIVTSSVFRRSTIFISTRSSSRARVAEGLLISMSSSTLQLFEDSASAIAPYGMIIVVPHRFNLASESRMTKFLEVVRAYDEELSAVDKDVSSANAQLLALCARTTLTEIEWLCKSPWRYFHVQKKLPVRCAPS